MIQKRGPHEPRFGAVMTKSTGVGRHPPSQRTHGHSFVNGRATPEYNAWSSMKQRCLNPNDNNFSRYGGRGISVCEKWKYSFEAFFNDMGHRPTDDHSIDRIDNNGNYDPDNCRWAIKLQQARNTRSVRVVSYKDEIISLPELVDRLGLKLATVRQRINRGWPVERALK